MRSVQFRVLAPNEQRARAREPRRNWDPLHESLIAGAHLFVSEKDMKAKDLRYLQQNFLRRRKKGYAEYLRTSHVEGGWELWLEREPLRAN